MDFKFRVCVTGAAGYLGQQLIHTIIREHPDIFVLATDIVQTSPFKAHPNLQYQVCDIRDPEIVKLLEKNGIRQIIHLASVVNPGKKQDRGWAYSVDVEGTRNLLEAAIQSHIEQIIVTSSGAAYGYHADHPDWINEDWPLRGNYEFAYAWHKKNIEEMLTQVRKSHPQLRQLIFRSGTILGDQVDNQITALFDKDPIPAIKNCSSPFVFIWDQDVVGAILKGLRSAKEGIYNLAGDGALDMAEIGRLNGHEVRYYPQWLLKMALFFLKLLRRTPYGPEQVRFLAFRPVLNNKRLKTEFGYVPQKNSRQVFEYYLDHKNLKT